MILVKTSDHGRPEIFVALSRMFSTSRHLRKLSWSQSKRILQILPVRYMRWAQYIFKGLINVGCRDVSE